MVDIIEFEPGAAPLLFVQLRDAPGGAVLDGSAVQFMLSVALPEPAAACVPLLGIYDAVRNGFNIDLNELAELVKPRTTYKCYFYVKYDVRWIASGELRIKPKAGCIWQPLI